jgi:hypothetical protein
MNLIVTALLAVGGQDQTEQRIQELIRSLEDENKEVRDKAAEDLAKIGKPALTALLKAAESKDPEVKSLAQLAIEKIEWGRGSEQLRKHVQEALQLKDAKLNKVEMPGAQRWFPNTRFFEMEPPPPAAGAPGAMVGMGGRGGTAGLFAIRKDDDAFYRIAMKGIIAKQWLVELTKKENVRLSSDEEAFDFAVFYLELYWRCSGAANVYYSGYSSDFVRTADGWEIQSPNYGTRIVFKKDSESRLADVGFGQIHYSLRSIELNEEKTKLEIEKLKAELELLKRK